MSLRSKQERLSPFLMTGILFEKERFVMLVWIREMLYIDHNHSRQMLKTSLFSTYKMLSKLLIFAECRSFFKYDETLMGPWPATSSDLF